MYWIEEVTAGRMDTALIPHIEVAHSQKGKKHKAEATHDNPSGGCEYGKPKNM